MEALDLHPEELFDKANKGLASSDELARIDAHLASCSTCRFERQVRMDFDAVGGTPANLDDLVARALSGAKPVPEAPRRRRMGPLLIAAAVALMGFGSFAAVAQFTGVLPRLFNKTEVIELPALPPSPSPRRKAVEPPPAPVPAPEVIAPIAEAPAPEVVAPIATPPTRPTAKPVVVKVAPPAPGPVEPDAIAILARATQARVNGVTAAAIRDFRVVIARFPETPEAALSHAALGRLLLDRGDPLLALASFDAYLASNNQLLREDVQGSRAMALGALGRFDEERAAWTAVLHDYPSGVFAPRARSRLDSLTP